MPITPASPLAQIESRIAPLVAKIHQHQLFPAVNSMQRLQQFVEVHVYAVELWE